MYKRNLNSGSFFMDIRIHFSSDFNQLIAYLCLFKL